MAAPLTFDSAYRTLKRGVSAPVYYLTGGEELLKQEIVALILEKAVEPADRDFNLDTRAAGDLDGESFHTLVETPPMLAERRAVLINNLEQWRKNARVWHVVRQYLANPSPTTVLVLTDGPSEKPRKDIAQRAVHIAVQALSPDRLRRWIAVRAKGEGIELTDEAAEHLQNAVGADLSVLAMEIEKLAAAASSEARMEANEVAALVGVRRGETLQDWVGAVVGRDMPRAIAMLDVVLATAGATGVRMVSALGTGLIGVRLARALLDRGLRPTQVQSALLSAIRSARPLGLRNWPDQASLWTRASEAWPARDIEDALRAAYGCDRALKSTTVTDERGTLSSMLLCMSPVPAAA